jgi:aminoglycoside phosphotransferase (APT) family kinase protein
VVDATQFDQARVSNRATAAVTARWPGAELRNLRLLPGGTSSLTFVAELAVPDCQARDVVVKLAPPGLPPVGNRDVLRQARLLRLLGAVPGVRVPGVLLEEDGEPPLFIMDFVPGECYEPLVDVSANPPPPSVVTARAQAAAGMLARLHRLDPAAIGVTDPAVTVAGELDRWIRLFATVDDSICPGHAGLRARLLERVPAGVQPRVLHGDYRVGNMLFVGEDLTAIIDWEIWGVGDPRTDLAWLLTLTDPLHRFHEPRDARNTQAGRGMPTLAQLLDVYLQAEGAPIDDLEWFLAYVQYKMASILSTFVKRNRRRAEPDPMLLAGEERLPAIIGRGNEILDARDAQRTWRR